MDKLQLVLQKLRKNHFFKYGLPFLVFVVGTPFALQEFTSLRYEFRRTKGLSHEELAREGIYKKKLSEVTLENIYETIKDIDLDNWSNIRGPRIGEDNTEFNRIKQTNLEEKMKKIAIPQDT